MKITAAGVELIKSYEGCELVAYRDGAGIWSIGYGHTGPDVFEGLVITQAHAEALFLDDLSIRDVAVLKECPTATAEQHSGMVSLAYNIGVGNFRGSSVCRFHNARAYDKAADSFVLWDKDHAGKTEAGLVARRAAEKALYTSTTGVTS